MKNSFENYLDEFIEWMDLCGWSDRTIESYICNIRLFFCFLSKKTKFNSIYEIDKRCLLEYQRYLYRLKLNNGKRLAISSQHFKLVAVRALFRYLKNISVVNSDPSAFIVLPKKRKSLPKNILNEVQMKTLLYQPDTLKPLGLRDKAIIELLYATGIRNTELRNLQIYDIDFEQLHVFIQKGKYGKDRIIPLGEIAADYLYDYISSVREQLIKDTCLNFLFLSKNGKQITKANLIWIVDKYAKKAGLLKRITPHSLRHSYATHLLQNGADIRYIQELLGHASVETTQIYTRVVIDDLKEVYQKTHPRALREILRFQIN